MEKTNFTSQPFGWAKSAARAFALLVICCFAFQSATANHLVPIVGPQTVTPFSPADPSTFVEINPEDKILFKDGKTAIIVAQGMNCGEMTYEFFDGGSHLSNYSDNGGDQYFTICPQTPMTQRIVSVQFSEFNLEWQISEIFDEVVDQNEDRNGVDDTATGTPPPEVTPTGTVIRNIQIKRDVLNIWDGDDAVMGQDPRMMDDFTMYYLENFREDVVLAGDESVSVADASAPNPASPTTSGASDPNNDTDYPGTNFNEAARIATLATGDDHAAHDNNPALPVGYGFDFLDDDIDDDVQDGTNAVITPNPYDPGTPADIISDMRPDDDNTTATPPLFNDDDQDGGGIDYMYSVTMSGFDSGDADGYDRDATNLPNAGNPIYLRKGDCDAQDFATQALGDGSGCITFQLTTDGSGVASGWEATIAVEEFAPAVNILGLNGNGNNIPNQDADEIDGDGVSNADNNLVVEIEDCGDDIPAQTLLVDFSCGLTNTSSCNTPFSNPFYSFDLAVGTTPVYTGSGVTADPQNIPVPGTALGIGENEVCITLNYRDAAGTVTEKSESCYTITVTTLEPLACNDDLNIGLDNDCLVTITPDVVLESPCEVAGVTSSDYVINLNLVKADDDFMNPQGITGDGIGMNNTAAPTVQIPGRYRYTITLGGNTCWGFLNLEDKRGPVCAPAGDLERFIAYDRNCDGAIDGGDAQIFANNPLGLDPSGFDDLESEYVLCTVLDAAEESGVGLGIFFDELEPMTVRLDLDGDNVVDAPLDQLLEGDFFDCTGINNIFFDDDVTEICSLNDLNGFPIDIAQYDENRFEICTVYSRTWSAIDKKGYQSSVGCTQYIFSLRPKASIIQLDQEAVTDCANDPNDACFQQTTAPYFTINALDNNGAVVGPEGIVNAGQGSGASLTATPLRNVCAGPTATYANPLAKVYTLTPNEQTCKYAVSFHQDQIIPICTDDNGDASAYKVNRHWTVVDWCNGDRVYDEFTQLIKVEDNTAPALISENGRPIIVENDVVVEDYRTTANPTDLRPYSIMLGTKLFDCEASGNLPLLTTQDNCSADDITRITIERLNVGGHEENVFINDFRDASGAVGNGASVNDLDLPLGQYEVTYIFSDDCGNANEISVPLNFFDNRIPEAICNDELVVSLVPGDAAGDQRARIYGEDIDDSSFDACWPVILEVRKAGDPEANDGDADFGWREFVEFDCSDVTPVDGEGIRVEVRVTEDRNDNGRIDVGDRLPTSTVADPVYLSNICWGYIRVEDKTPPVISLPDGEYLCDDPELNALILAEGLYDPADGDELFPTFIGGCSTEGIVVNLLDVDESGYDPICKVGTFSRTFRAQRVIHDNVIFGNEDTQTIDVFFNSEWTMIFPPDIIVECDEDAALTAVPPHLRIEDIIDNQGCDQWGMEVSDETFDIIGQDGDGACFKVVRTYKFINWCTWDPTNSEEGVVPRPIDFDTRAGAVQVLAYQSNPVLGICNLRNNIDDRFDGDAYDLITANYGQGGFDGNPNTTNFPAERDGDFIYVDESTTLGNGGDDYDDGVSGDPTDADNFDPFDDCIDDDFNAIFDTTIDFPAGFANALIYDDQNHNFVSAEAYGYFIYRQVIKVADSQLPVIDEIDDFTTCDDEDELAAAGITVVEDFENCSVQVTFPIPVVDECKPTYRIFYELDANNDGSIELAGELNGDGAGNFGALTVSGIPYGTHGLRYIVEDGCGNNDFIDFDFTALDCKAPTAYCVLGINIDLMPTGMVAVWASDLDAGSFDDCSEPVQLSFSPNPADTGRIFTCDMRGSNFVQLWVTDAAGNQSFCETIVNVQADNPEECGVGAAIVSGVNTEMGEDVENVTLGLSGASNETATTDVEGQFTFGNLTPGQDYTVTPEKDLNPLNGVSTFDLVLIRKHIIDVAPLDSPYKLIAADVNNSGNITTLDMIRLRELILNIRTDFENNTSWRFVDAAYEFPTPSNPWAEEFPEVVNFNDIVVEMNEANFIAVKVGDVNASAIPNMLLGSDERNSADVLAFNVADAAVVAGQEVTVDFTAEMVDVAGFQFTLNFDNNVLDLVEIVEGVATAENFGTTLANEGTITASWDGEATADDVLFSLTFAAKATANLSELITVNSTVTAAEAYKGTEVLDVALNFGGANTAAGFELYQNTPNPFKGITTVSFNLPTAGAATLTVTDVTGKVLKVTQANYAKGFNQVQFSSADLKATGVLYYTLESADYTATKKMIIVE